MKKFTEVYTKARDVLTTQKYEAAWQTFLADTCSVKSLVGATGFNSANAAGLEKLRTKIKADGASPKTTGSVILAASQSGDTAGSLQARAATLKMLAQTYLVQRSGGQD